MATPAEVEARLIALSKEYDGAYSDLAEADQAYLVKKAQLEIAMARSRMTYAGMSSPTGKNYTVGERENAVKQRLKYHLKPLHLLKKLTIKFQRLNLLKN